MSEWAPYILAGIAIQNMRGALSVAEKRGRENADEEGWRDGLREGVEAICHLLGIELTEDRRHQLTTSNAAELRALLARLGAKRSWT